ncbi:MAG: AAA family ATPase, partial [Proteobacteria bacterium]|nr:AAA family ATPase [Pseudomonadota bacterium]
MLIDEIRRFFQTLTNNPKVIELAVQIQQGLEKGHTAIESKELLTDELISHDGSQGYIVQSNRLSGFRRFYQQEKFIQQDFNQSKVITIEEKPLKQALEKVCAVLNIDIPSPELIDQDKQWQACMGFLTHSRYIISGGPGTGKTTTVVRMLLLFKAINTDPKIALAAPTGKAANRMMQSINHLLPDSEQQAAQTLHRLMGYNHQTNTLKYNRNNPMPYDLIIVDEASMLDVTLTSALIKALKPNAQLLLIGDKNQLPAVEAGNVFSDLCALSSENTIQLEKNYRFNKESKIAQMCNSLIKQDLPAFNETHTYFNPSNKLEKQQSLQKWYQQVGDESALLLSPIKYGNNSVNELNDLAIKTLYNNKKLNANMPIIVNTNDYTLGVFNGDIGQLKLIAGQWQVAFNNQGQKQLIKLDAIKHWQVAHAITIHKSQGSEYDHILIAIPDDLDLEILGNQLLYTAISRAKKSVTLWASNKIIAKIIAKNEQRITFLN